MRIKSVLVSMIASMAIMWADNMILDFETIAQIELNLKPNQTLMIDHKRGVLLGIMEVSPNGAIKRLPIPKELLGKSEADVMGSVRGDYNRETSNFGGSSTTIYYKDIKGKAKIPSGKEKSVENPKETLKKREGDREWNKSKIIYEQQEETLDIAR